jgi:hypothetical protein
MDDFNLSSLKEARNEWCVRLINILTPQMVIGIRSIFNSAKSLCAENNEMEKYLLTFQNFLTRIPQWNNELIQKERERICEASGCSYLADLITCIHIIYLKMLTSIRVGNKQKKVDLAIPTLDAFLHRAYVNTARQLYNKAYLFSLEVKPLEQQKNNTQIEEIIQKCILDAVRTTIPVENILRSYLEETEEQVEEVKEEIIKETIKPIKEEVPVPFNEKKKGGEGGEEFGYSNVPASIPKPFDDAPALQPLPTHFQPPQPPIPSQGGFDDFSPQVIDEPVVSMPSSSFSSFSPSPSVSPSVAPYIPALPMKEEEDNISELDEVDFSLAGDDGGELELNF